MIPIAEPEIGEKELEYVIDAVKSGWVSSLGDYIKKFEKKFAEFCQTNYAISCNNGTSALHLALLALGIGEGDEVILPTLTFATTANVVKYVGGKPILIDSEQETWNIDAVEIEKRITNKTKAIIVVHLYGLPCDMDLIMDIAKKYNLYVVEDCAEAHGAEYKGKKVGSIGDIGCFSFFGNKIMTTGEGGMCVTNNEKLKDKMELFKNHGMSKERTYWHSVIGYNYRMTNIQAAIGLAQLEKIDLFIEKKINIANIYKRELKDLKNIQFMKEKSDRKNVYWMFNIFSEAKDKIRESLNQDGISTRPLFIPLHLMPPYKSRESFPMAEKFSLAGLTLPSSTKLTEEQIVKICDIIKRVIYSAQ